MAMALAYGCGPARWLWPWPMAMLALAYFFYWHYHYPTRSLLTARQSALIGTPCDLTEQRFAPGAGRRDLNTMLLVVVGCGGLWRVADSCGGLWWFVVGCGGLWWVVQDKNEAVSRLSIVDNQFSFRPVTR